MHHGFWVGFVGFFLIAFDFAMNQNVLPFAFSHARRRPICEGKHNLEITPERRGRDTTTNWDKHRLMTERRQTVLTLRIAHVWTEIANRPRKKMNQFNDSCRPMSFWKKIRCCFLPTRPDARASVATLDLEIANKLMLIFSSTLPALIKLHPAGTSYWLP